MSFNPLNYVLCFEKPQRLTDITSWHEHIPFAYTIVQMLKPKIFVELGTHKGDSYCAFCQAVNVFGLDTACYAVDTWEGDEHAGFYGHEIFDELKTYHDSLYKGFSQLIQSRFEDALDYFSDGSIDLIHIDGCHTYDAIKHDFESWLPKLSQRGVVLLHDVNVHENNFGVWKFWEEIAEHYPSFEFKHGYGLGVLAVGAYVPEEVLNFLNMEEQEVVATTKLYSYLGDKIALGHQLQARNAQINELNGALQARDAQINELNGALQARDAQINELNGAIQARDTQIDELNGAIQVKDAQIDELNGAIQTKDAQINELNGAIQVKDAQIDELNGAIQTKDAQIDDLNSALQAKDVQINELNGAIQEKNRLMLNLRNEIHDIQQSVVWTSLMKFQKIIDLVLPHETKRRHCYDLGLLSIRTIVNEGWRSFWWKVKHHIRQVNPKNKRKTIIEKINIPKNKPTNQNEMIDIKVSIVIPTKNAGNNFEYVLNKIKSQKGIKELELLVIDSGSEDETLNIAMKYRAKLHQIKPEDFRHGDTRNIGAEKATGDFILFATQDAIFASKYLIYNMIKTLQRDVKIAAVTCTQIPRSDADFMACFQVWNHYNKFLDLNENKVVFVKDMNISPAEKRKHANLSDSCCCIRKDIFMDYLYKVNFAEDLDLGIRLLTDGFKLAYLHDTAIIHSHNRPPIYFFKASYTDFKVVSQIIGNEPLYWKNNDMNMFYNCLKKLYIRVSKAISIIEKDTFVTSPDTHEYSETVSDQNTNKMNHLFRTFEALLNSEKLEDESMPNHVGEPTLNGLFDEIEVIIDYDKTNEIDDVIYNRLLDSYIESLNAFSEYINIYASLDQMEKDFLCTLYKLFANSTGATLGNYILYLNNEQMLDNDVKVLDDFLSHGV